MIFRQVQDPQSCTYTYVLGCPGTGEAVLVDPVLDRVDDDLAMLKSLGLRLTWTIDTHIHADHVTGAARLKSLTGSKIAFPNVALPAEADLGVDETRPLAVGSITLKPLFTPGHTNDHFCYLVDDSDGARLFTGDALLIGGCGRTDFQCGDAETLYRSVHSKLFSLPDDTIVLPGHDYQGREFSTIGEERTGNARLGGGKSVAEFVAIMSHLNLPAPRMIDIAVPANRRCGILD